MPNSPGVQILDCTIRDGGYVVDFQFTKEDTFIISQGLARAGIRYIEVGHGLGLNGSNTKGRAAEKDEVYIQSACEAVRSMAKVGSFFIPGIGREEDIHSATDAGLSFIRLGVDVDEFAKLEPYVRLCKSLGLEIWANMMKSYIVKPEEFGAITKRVAEFGVDIVALVDSAGGMTPDDISAYAHSALTKCKIPLAFHGHNNLTLATANCLRFIEEGGSYVDGSLAGLGRSGGNAATELLAVLLSRKKRLAYKVDWEQLVEFADAVMQFCVPGLVRPRAVEIATGINYFHTGFSDVVTLAVNKFHASLFRTLLRLPPSSRKKVKSRDATTAARRAVRSQTNPSTLSATGSERLERTQPATLTELANRLRVDRGKFPQERVITIAHSPGSKRLKIGPLRKNPRSIVAHVEVADTSDYLKARKALSEVSELWLIDISLAKSLSTENCEPCYVYDDKKIIAQALADAIQMLGISKVVASGSGFPTGIIDILSSVALCKEGEVADALIAFSPDLPAKSNLIAQVRDGGMVIIVRPGALSASGFSKARRRGLAVWRLDCGAALIAEAERILSTRDQFRRGAGVRVLPNGRRIIAGGIVGEAGDIIVDRCDQPRFILGEADGLGGIRGLNNNGTTFIQQWIIHNWNL